MMNEQLLALLHKYDVQIPRYTSYPTVPYWDSGTLPAETWKNVLMDTYKNENGEISIYVHLPFCENLCTFCACNKRITINHNVEIPYIQSVLSEWSLYRNLFPTKPVIREIHLGGGTPTFFSPDNLVKLIKGITKDSLIPEDHEFSVEVHPNFTSREHLVALASVGFNRISLGVQDFDPAVQFVINRIQTFEKTKEVVDWARESGFESVNIDLVYGLPKQTVKSVELTIELINQLMPDRIAFYSYAHVPWKSKVQRRYTDADLPKAKDKWAMYHRGRELLTANGFAAIGMDHFALPEDKLLKAAAAGQMHRNFMGYTTTQNKLIIALGASSISDAWGAFAQNEKDIEAYQDKVNMGEFPIVNGHVLNKEDLLIRTHILELMCIGKTMLKVNELDEIFVNEAFSKFKFLEEDGLVEIKERQIIVTEKGAIFIRNISAVLDAKLWRNGLTSNVFSKAI